ncbi:MAG: FAD-dependent monooxygenase, partial [Burkholderiaceae bacterium]
MNLDIGELPASCDVLVVGAGPAGSAAAQWLARAGRDVVLVDQHAFPRDKVCGDGLIADALRALGRLGVLEQVLSEAHRSATLGCIGPSGGRIDVPGSLAVLPRKRLDQIVCRAAVDAGARMFAPLRFVAPLREAGRVVGARLEQGGTVRELRTPWLVLATGAQPQATLASDLCQRRAPSGIALRGYVRNAAMTARITSLEIVWHKRLSPGYGWIFPCGADVFNIGVGVAQEAPRGGKLGREAPHLNLREAFAAFKAFHAPA